MIFYKVRELREEKDWTQQYIADLLFVNRRTYSAYETGVNAMSPEILIKLAQIHRTSVDYILGLTNNPKPYDRV